MSRADLERLFLDSLPTIDAIVAAIARRHALTRDTADDFAGWTKFRIFENDYAVLAKFRGEAQLATYLTIVVTRYFGEYRAVEWGRWRSSAEAKRGGPLAIRLESLLLRDGVPFTQAAEMLRSSGATSLSDRELAVIAAAFPARSSRRPSSEYEAADVAGDDHSDASLIADQSRKRRDAILHILGDAMRALPAEGRMIVRMHFANGLSIADIARALDLPHKPLYRRLASMLKEMRLRLEDGGISLDDIRDLPDADR